MRLGKGFRIAGPQGGNDAVAHAVVGRYVLAIFALAGGRTIGRCRKTVAILFEAT